MKANWGRIKTISFVVGAHLFLVLMMFAAFWLTPDEEIQDATVKTDIIVVGAGSSGLTAGYLLEEAGYNVTIIEAQDVYGGRMREAQNFADFPIDLGAEWIHEDPSILDELFDKETNIETILYNPSNIFEWDGENLSDQSLFSFQFLDYKFKSTTWFDYFETNVVPSIRDRIILSEPVSSIDYTQDKVIVKTVDNQTFEPKNTYRADQVLVTVPVTVLQKDFITFRPELPQEKRDAINDIAVPDGIKVFVEFDEKFYPDGIYDSRFTNDDSSAEKYYYDAAFGKDAEKNVLGLFTIGPGATELVGKTDEEIIETVLAELDAMFDGKATESYVQHIVQNWTTTQFIEGSYSTDFLENRTKTMRDLAEPIDGRIFFSGEAMSDDYQATVIGASQTARDAVIKMTNQ